MLGDAFGDVDWDVAPFLEGVLVVLGDLPFFGEGDAILDVRAKMVDWVWIRVA